MIVIIDYGLGNLRSVAGAVKRVGFDVCISNKWDDLKTAESLILPGVGAFGDGMRNLRDLGLVEMLNELVMKEKKAILGICLGSQLMAKESFEFGHHEGLGWIDASVVRIDAQDGLRIPHVGWNHLWQTKKDNIFKNIPQGALFYYVHSFYVQPREKDIVIGECEYGIRFPVAFRKDNICGTQFHPEKSQLCGLELLKNFLKKA